MCFTIYSRSCTFDSTSTFQTISLCFLLWEVGEILAPPACSVFVNQQTNADRNQIRVFQSSQCTSKGNSSSSWPSFGLHCLCHWRILHGLQLHPPIIPGGGGGEKAARSSCLQRCHRDFCPSSPRRRHPPAHRKTPGMHLRPQSCWPQCRECSQWTLTRLPE